MFGYIPSINCDQAAAAQMQPGPCQLHLPARTEELLLEVLMGLRDTSQCPEKAPTRRPASC